MNPSLLTREALGRYAHENRAAFEAELKHLVEIPSISADPTQGLAGEKGWIHGCSGQGRP